MDISSALRTARRVWIAIVALALVGAAAGALVTLLRPAGYTSTTSLYFAYDAPSDASPSDLVQANNFALQKVFSYQALATSPRVLQGVVSDLGLSETPEDLAEDVTVSVAENSVVMTITADADNPQDAAVLAQSVADNLVEVVVDQLEAPSTGGAGPLRAEVIAPASEGESSTLSHLLIGVQLGLFGGLVVGLAGAIVLTLADRRVRSRAELEGELGLRVLGGVPAAGSRSSGLQVLEAPSSPAAAGYRAAAAALLLDSSAADARGLAVLASTEREDAAETAANLAVAVAASGFSVLLVDADPSGRGVTQRFGLDGVPGLVELLGGAEVKPSSGPVPNLHLLPSGDVAQLSAGVLPAAAFTDLVEELTPTADLVLVSCPPVLGGAGYRMTASACGAVLLVVRAGTVTSPQVRAALGDLEETGLGPVGTVMTGMRTKGPDSDPAVRALAARKGA